MKRTASFRIDFRVRENRIHRFTWRELSGRVGRQQVAGESVAFVQYAVDFLDRLFAMARRAAGAQGLFEPCLHIRRVAAAGECAGEAFGLTREIVEGGFQGA